MRSTTAHKPWWLLPRYAVASPVIAAVALLIGLLVAASTAYVLHDSPIVVAAAAMLACSATSYGLHAVRTRALYRIDGDPVGSLVHKLEHIAQDRETKAVARYRAQAEPAHGVDALLAAIMPADSATPSHHSARGGAR